MNNHLGTMYVNILDIVVTFIFFIIISEWIMGHLSVGFGVYFYENDPLICSQYVSFGSIVTSIWVSKDGKEPVRETYWCLSTREGNCEHILVCKSWSTSLFTSIYNIKWFRAFLYISLQSRIYYKSNYFQFHKHKTTNDISST